MQKVTAFLEQHIQWLAIGLGALFCLFMIWSYVITPPATAQIGSESFGPSEVDPHTAETVVQKLQAAMQNNARIKMEVPQYVQSFQDTMTWKAAKPVQLANMTDPSLKFDVQLPVAQPDPNAQPPNGQQPIPGQTVVANAGGGGAKITQLPIPPKPKQADANTFVKYGRSVVVPPPPGTPPGTAPPAPQPGIVPPGAVDTDWVTQMWTVSMPDIQAAFLAAGMNQAPEGVRNTMFLQVEMVREEMVDGKWQNAMVIPHRTPTRNNQPMQPYPGDGPDPALKQAQYQYAAWASTSTPDIIQPLFHVTVPNKGDQWTKPGQQLVAAVFDPRNFRGDLNALPKEQKDAVLQFRREQQKILQEQKKANRPAPRAPTGPPGGGRGAPPGLEGDSMNYAPRRPNYAPAREELPHYAVPPGAMRPPPYPIRGGAYGNPNLPPDMMEMEGESGYGGGYAGPQQVNMPQPGTDYPTGEFDPTAPAQGQTQPWRTKDVEIWAHDDQVVAGKTYRYKMRYRLKNPIFGTNAAENPDLVNKFALVSDFSDWTTPITVPSLVNFFVAGGVMGNKRTVAFEVFRWDQGQQKKERFEVGPGDLVGSEKNGVDFSTDWTVVDFRDDPRAGESQILLVNNKDGSVVARSFTTDRNDKLYQALQKQVSDAKAAETAAAGGVPGAVGTAAAR